MSDSAKSRVKLSGITKQFTRQRGLLNFFSASAVLQETKVLRGLNLELFEGDALYLTGANGSGKTTLVKIAAGLVLADSGQRTVTGKIAYVPAQDQSFYERLTGLENLHFFGMLSGYSRREREQKINESADIFGISFLDARVQEYSSGMKQRLSLARAILSSPEILLLDEPWRSLDPESAENFQTKILELLKTSKLRAVLCASPVPPAFSWPGRRAHLENGSLREVGGWA